MAHMLNAEHFGVYDATLAGATRDYATLSAALTAIGSLNRILLIPYVGDGIWTFNTNWTIPSNVILWVAPGVKIAGSGNATINGQIVAYDPAWYTGSGTITLPATTASYFGNVVAKSLGLNIAPPLTQIHVSGDGAWPAVIRLEERAAGQTAAVQWYSNAIVRGQLGLPGTQHITLNLSNSAHFVVSGGSLGLGMTPTQQLELSGSVAQKASGTTWANPSDERIKDVQRPYTDGLNVVMEVAPYWVKFNGLAGTPASLPEFVAILAQELQPHAPYMIGSYEAKLHPDDEGPTEILNFDGSTLIFALVNAVKEQQALIEALTTRVTALETP